MKALAPTQVQESQQFLTFLLEDQEFGLEIFKIREIRGYAPITPTMNLPPHVCGVMNVRGTVLPVIDLRMKFNLPAVAYNRLTVLVMARVGEKAVGLLVDALSDVLTVGLDAIAEVHDFGESVDTGFINGVLQSRNRLAVALNLEQLLSESELALPQSVEA